MLDDAIIGFTDQCLYEPSIEGVFRTTAATRFLIVGMGGSHLAADIVQKARPDVAIRIHSDYDVPPLSAAEQAETLVILSSYSGNTEEVLSAAERGLEQGLTMGVIAVGGKLIEFARAHQLPYIQLPKTGIQPRSALGFSVRALQKMMGLETDLQTTRALATTLQWSVARTIGESLATQLYNTVPIIYTSTAYAPIGYNWKIKFNENVKIPAFCNQVPELNHNEMNGFDVVDSTRGLMTGFTFIFLQAATDHPHNKKRFTALRKLYEARNLRVLTVEITGENFYEQVFSSLLIADWVTVHLAQYYGQDAEQVPMVEEFKKIIAG